MLGLLGASLPLGSGQNQEVDGMQIQAADIGFSFGLGIDGGGYYGDSGFYTGIGVGGYPDYYYDGLGYPGYYSDGASIWIGDDIYGNGGFTQVSVPVHQRWPVRDEVFYLDTPHHGGGFGLFRNISF